jgi:hypothetical protein
MFFRRDEVSEGCIVRPSVIEALEEVKKGYLYPSQIGSQNYIEGISAPDVARNTSGAPITSL